METPTIVELPIEQLFISKGNVRTLQIESEELIPSIIQEGKIIKPLDVYPAGDNFAAIDGQRRLLALQKILNDQPELKDKFSLVPCIVHYDIHNDEEALEFSFINSILGRDTPPLDKARAARLLIEKYGSQQQVCKRFGFKKSTLSELDSINDLNPQVLELMKFNGRTRPLSVSEAIQLTKLPKEKQLEVAMKVLEADVTVTEGRDRIKAERGVSTEDRVPLVHSPLRSQDAEHTDNGEDREYVMSVMIPWSLYGLLDQDSKGNRKRMNSLVLDGIKTQLQRDGFLEVTPQ